MEDQAQYHIDQTRARFWVKILGYPAGLHNSQPQLLHRWDGLPYQVRLRWDWFFRYKAARFQVEHPHWCIELSHGRIDHIMTDEEAAAKALADKLQAAKGRYTKILNRVSAFRAEYTGLFYIEEDPVYQKLIGLLSKAIANLNELTQKQTDEQAH
jgi:hypothetical protein